MVGLTIRSFAREAGVDPSTVHRFQEAGGLRSTERKLEGVLVRREQQVLRHLLALHGRSDLYDQIIPASSADATRTTLDAAPGGDAEAA